MPERTEKPIAHTTEIKRSDFPVKRTISRTSLFSIKVLVIWRVFFWGVGLAWRAHLRGGVAKSVLYACIGGEGVKKGQKTACALLECPLMVHVISLFDQPSVNCNLENFFSLQ